MTFVLQKSWQAQLAASEATLTTNLLKLIPLRKAFNHHEHLLITALVINQASVPYSGQVISTHYHEAHLTATTSFAIHDLTLQPGEATVWTIIFNHHPFTLTDLTTLTH